MAVASFDLIPAGCRFSAVCGSFAAELAAFFKIPAMVCINKFDLNPDEGEAIEAFAKQRNIKVMGRVPCSEVQRFRVQRFRVQSSTVKAINAKP